MNLIENVLDSNTLTQIQKSIKYEVDNFPCLMVPKHQSYATMHKKYRFYDYWKTFQSKIIELAETQFSKRYQIHSCWFNICKQDSNFTWHAHVGYDMTCVFYALNCENNGTIIKNNNNNIHLPAKDNSLMFLKPEIEHTVPDWNGVDRYSIAFQFLKY